MKKELSWQSLGEINEGTLGMAIDLALAEVLKDCNERPGLGKAREVSIKLKLLPQSVQNPFDVVSISAEITKKLPGRSTLVENLSIKKVVNDAGEVTAVIAEVDDGQQALFAREVYASNPPTNGNGN